MDVVWGWRSDLEDRESLMRGSRDYTYRLRGRYEVPEEVDPRPWMRIEDQANQGSCQGHALTTVCEQAYWIATGGQIIQFSEMWAYLKSQEKDGIIGDRGSTIEGGQRTAMQDGLCTDTVFPYPSRYSRDIPNGAAEEAQKYKIRRFQICRSYQDVFDWIAAGLGGINIGMMWGGGLMDVPSGIIERFDARGGGGHAVAYAGYTKRKAQDGRNYILQANSWGTRWGNSGWAEWSPAAIDQALNHQWTVAIGLTDMSSPRPRKIPKPSHEV